MSKRYRITAVVEGDADEVPLVGEVIGCGGVRYESPKDWHVFRGNIESVTPMVTAEEALASIELAIAHDCEPEEVVGIIERWRASQ